MSDLVQLVAQAIGKDQAVSSRWVQIKGDPEGDHLMLRNILL